MPAKPAAEIEADEGVVRQLLRDQATSIPDAASLPLRRVAEGWDCVTWRLGDQLAVRVPRRAVACPLILNEQRSLPGIAARLTPTTIAVPTPLVAGQASAAFPWPWSVVPWIPGDAAMRQPRGDRGTWAIALARAARALHVTAPGDYPRNPVRGVPLAERADLTAARLASLHSSGHADREALDALEEDWKAGLSAPAWGGSPLCLHGDLHPGNLVVDAGRLSGIIDFGDVTAGDPAYDLAVAWLAFDQEGRDAFVSELAGDYDAATWVRARAWAAAFTVVLLDASDDDPEFAGLGREVLAELTRPEAH